MANLAAIANGQQALDIPGPGATASGASPYAGYVWMGQRGGGVGNVNLRASEMAKTAIRSQGTGPLGVPLQQAQQYAINLLSNDKERARVYAKISKAYGVPITSFDQFQSAWKDAVSIAQQSWEATKGGTAGKPLSVWDVIDLRTREAAKYGAGGVAGATTTVSRSSSVEKLSDGSMWSVLKGAATNLLGRAPTNSELQRFASRANQLASSHPTTSKTTTTSSAGGSTSHTSTKQGASAGDYELAAENQLNATPEAGAYQAASTYANALFRGLESPV